jgi:YVTN family beta-propeller protein
MTFFSSSGTRSPSTRRPWWIRGLVLAAASVLLGACGSSHVATPPATTTTPPTSTTTTLPSSTTAPATTDPTPSTSVDIYSHDGLNDFAPAVQGVPYRIYVPESGGSDVDVIDPATYQVIARYETGLDPQHVVPAWDLKTLYATNDLGNSLTPIDPMTGRPAGPNIPVSDPYNMYFTPDGRYAIVVEEARQTLAFRDPHTFALEKAVHVNCAGVDHADFSAHGTYAIFSCEFSGKLVKIDLATQTVAGYLYLPGSSPQDVKLNSAGTIFYVADMNRGGVYEISAATFSVMDFIPTGRDAHGLYISRDTKDLYVTDRGAGEVSVIDLATRQVVDTWHIPGGGSPDMGNVSPDGKVLWVSGRYNACVYAISTVTGQLLAKIPVPNSPHGLAVWPQPGRYSLGHTGIMR